MNLSLIIPVVLKTFSVALRIKWCHGRIGENSMKDDMILCLVSGGKQGVTDCLMFSLLIGVILINEVLDFAVRL